ncbi:putative glutathione S-transferase 1 [Lophiostoma macrostomum CBS 122681]|uniref:Putative glutathione S-transferase 1 n=1 Tax=Lophiostoma macrostomum CBS 122681 TaxID=1314788 RepID=A0A6A6T5T9_9PLEO|nr:putative glutathione S-transferase 1 [Lophiostoma macrostomum CBS 122681]
MASTLKPIKVWGKGGPNPPKVSMLLEVLGVPYEAQEISFADLKKTDYLAINPNGRMPSIQDPNTGITVWESGAIFEYIIEKYDTEKKLSFEPGTTEYYHAKQWLFFQVSGQGPYYGQFAWFFNYHPEKIESAINRYAQEVKRVTGVLEGHLKAQKEKAGTGSDGPWLVGDKFSYADIVFVTWQHIADVMIPDDLYDAKEFPVVKEWLARLTAKEGIKKVVEQQLSRAT